MPAIILGNATKPSRFWSLLTRCTIPCACHVKRHLNLQKWSGAGVFCTFWLGNVLRATTTCTFSTSQLPKVVRRWCDLEMCFAPQRRALCWHLKRQKWSAPLVLLTFWLGNVLRATTACTFSTSQLPKVVRTWCVLCILTWKRASRHNGVHFFNISISKSGPTMVCFDVFCTFWLRNVLRATTACNFSSLLWPDGSAPAALASLLFDPPEPQIIGKTQWIATFLPFRASPSSFFLLFLFYSSYSFSSTLLSSDLSFLSASSLLCFSSVHIVGSLTSKLPSITYSDIVSNSKVPVNPNLRISSTLSCWHCRRSIFWMCLGWKPVPLATKLWRRISRGVARALWFDEVNPRAGNSNCQSLSRQQVSYNPTCDTIYSTAMGNVREISRGLRRVHRQTLQIRYDLVPSWISAVGTNLVNDHQIAKG